MPYSLPADLAAELGAEAYLRVWDVNRTGAVSPADVARAIFKADTIIDEILSGAVAPQNPAVPTPIFSVTVPENIHELSMMLAPWEAVKSRLTAGPTFASYRQLWEDARSRLRAIAHDTDARIPADGPSSPTADLPTEVHTTCTGGMWGTHASRGNGFSGF